MRKPCRMGRGGAPGKGFTCHCELATVAPEIVMKRSVVIWVSTLWILGLGAHANGVDFRGSFLDLLVELDTNHDLTIGLDPFEFENPKVTEVREYSSGSVGVREFIEAEVKRLGLLMKQGSGGAFYATSATSSKRDQRLALFVDRKYAKLAETQGGSDPLVQLAKLIESTRRHSRARIVELERVAGEVKARFPGLDKELKLLSAAQGKGREVSDQRFSKLYTSVDELAKTINRQIDLINTDYGTYMGADESASLFGELVRDYGSLALATRAYLEYMVYRIEPVSQGIKLMDPYHGCAAAIGGKTIELTAPGTFASRFKPEIKRELIERDAKIKALGRTIDQGLDDRRGQLDSAIRHWKASEFQKAYKEVSMALMGGDLSSQTRALYGLFWTRAQSEYAKQIRSRAKRTAPIDFQAMAGVDERFVEQFKSAYPGVARGAVPRPQNPGRRGASYGLTVSREAGQVSTFGIQTRPRGSGEVGGALISGGTQQIEVNAVGEGFIDDHMIASIHDSLNYVSGQHVPTLFDDRIVILFDSTVDIAYGGDSAGAALATATLSESTGLPPPPDVCMTGAVRAFGDVRPVGGIREKTKAARDQGFRVLLAPLENEPSFNALPRAEQIGPCQIILGKTMDDYLPFGLPELEGVDTTPRQALSAYAFAFHLFLAGRLDESLGLCEAALAQCPNHYSARSLATLLRIAGARAVPAPDPVTKFLAAPAKAG